MKNNNIQKDWTELLRDKAGSYAGDKPEMTFAELKEKMLSAAAGQQVATSASRRGIPAWLKYAAAVAVVAAGGVFALTQHPAGESQIAELTDAGEDEIVVVAQEEPVAGDTSHAIDPSQYTADDAASAGSPSAASKASSLRRATASQTAYSNQNNTDIITEKADGSSPAANTNYTNSNSIDTNVEGNTGDSASADSASAADAKASDSQGADASKDSQGADNAPAAKGIDETPSTKGTDETPAAKGTDEAPSTKGSAGQTAPAQNTPATKGSPANGTDPFAEPVKPVRKQLKKFSLGASGFMASNSIGSGNADNAPKGMTVYTDKNGKVFYSFGAPTARYNHSAPISGGISLRYSITPAFFAETGLRFTYLHTWITPSGASQNLLYAGIPLGVGFNFLDLGNFDIYASAYGMPAKCVMGRTSANFPSNYAKLSDIPIMWSAGASLGAGYNITRTIGLFAEPTISYFFPDDNAPQTLYKENPWYSTLNLGVRFNL